MNSVLALYSLAWLSRKTWIIIQILETKLNLPTYTNVFEVLAEIDHLEVTSNVNLCCDFTLIDAVCTASVP